MQQALYEHLLSNKKEAESLSAKPVDALMYSQAIKNICEAMEHITMNLY